ncbi:hypothetical protein B0H11DRAFT_1964418 [Mycena galericulata]|nr:hypothetical protein B0H11DRAFT_1964418 [Mycena galericulata]
MDGHPAAGWGPSLKPRGTSPTTTISTVKITKKPPTAAIAGAIIAILVVMGLVAFVYFRRRALAARKPTDKIGGLERGPEPDVDSSNLLDGDGQPTDVERSPDTLSQTSSKRKIGVPVAAITAIAGDALLSFQRKLFKRPTTESSAEMELESPSALTTDPPTTSAPEISSQDGFFAKLKVLKRPTTESLAEMELEPSAVGGEAATESPPTTMREGFFVKIAKKVTRKTESTVDLKDEAGLTFQERLVKRPTTDSITVNNTPDVEVGISSLPGLVFEEPVNFMESQPESPQEIPLVEEPNESNDLTESSAQIGAGDAGPKFTQRFFKWTAKAATTSGNAPELETASSTSMNETSMSLPPHVQDTNSTTPSPEVVPKAGFMFKLRHKFSKPSVTPDLESGEAVPITTPPASAPSNSQKPDGIVNTDGPPLDSGSKTTLSLSRSATPGHDSQPTLVASSSHLQANAEAVPPPFVNHVPVESSTTTTEPLTRSFSTMKREQTRAIHVVRDDPGYIAPPSEPPPDETEPSANTRSLSTMKRDQTRAISREPQHSATDVLVQTPGGLQLRPGQSRVVSTDESRAVASELRDLREYIRVLEADLAAGGGNSRGPGHYVPVVPPPSYDETS